MIKLSAVQLFILLIIPVLFAITIHEVAHGWVALKFGDRTAQMLGRLTVNPIKHIDPLGTILVPTVMFFLSGFIFGWAKPVPVTWQNLKNPKRDMAFVALAGPGANLLMALFWGLICKLGISLLSTNLVFGSILAYMGIAGIFINILLMIINLVPIPPLDGSRIVSSIIPNKWDYYYSRIEPYGFFIILGLLLTGILFKIVIIPILLFVKSILVIFGIPPSILFSLRAG